MMFACHRLDVVDSPFFPDGSLGVVVGSLPFSFPSVAIMSRGRSSDCSLGSMLFSRRYGFGGVADFISTSPPFPISFFPAAVTVAAFHHWWSRIDGCGSHRGSRVVFQLRSNVRLPPLRQPGIGTDTGHRKSRVIIRRKGGFLCRALRFRSKGLRFFFINKVQSTERH